MLFALQGTGPAADRLRVLLAEPITDDALVDEALTLLRASDGIDRTRDVLAARVKEAQRELDQLPSCAAGDALRTLTTFMIDRTG
jgi:heptaprenyl diphosphate synthase